MSDTSQLHGGSATGAASAHADVTPKTPLEERMARVAQLRPLGERGRAHGKPSSWVLIGMVVAAFVTGGIALILHAWALLWVCVGVVVLAVPLGKAMGVMDDTVTWYDPLDGEDGTARVPAERGRREAPGSEPGTPQDQQGAQGHPGAGDAGPSGSGSGR